MPATDPFGDAWYCAGEGSTLTEVRKDNGFTSSLQFSMRGVTRLGECGETAGTASISASIYPSSTTGTYFAADITGTISAWNGTDMVASPNCYGSACNMRFRNAGQEHFVHVQTTLTDISLDTMGPTSVTSAVWLVQPSTTQPFAMACSSEGTLNYKSNEPSTLQLAKVTSPRSCPGTPIANARLDFTVER
ncbi:MAG: hypothetical protein ABJA82_09135 [Myxococcales bacterium]